MTKPKLPKKKVDSYLKYTGIGFQMAAVFVIGIFGGQWIDNRLGNETPYITVLLILVLFSAYMYKLYVDLNRPS